MSKVVRLKPYNRRKGHLLRRYVLGAHKFLEDRWYAVSDDMAYKLSDVHSRPDHPDESPLAFDVFESQKDAESQYHREQESEKKATVKNPEFVGTLTSADLPGAEKERTKRAEANLARAEAKKAKKAAAAAAKKAKAPEVSETVPEAPEVAPDVPGDDASDDDNPAFK